jgi:hypothetical protein
MANSQPDFTAFTVTKRGEGQDDWWTAIGAAWVHGDGQGYNIQLQTIPLDGKIVLKPTKESVVKSSEQRDNQSHDSNDRNKSRR